MKLSLNLPDALVAQIDAIRLDPQAQVYKRSRSATVALLLERQLQENADV